MYLQLVFYLFGPALVVSQLGETITFQSLSTLWVIQFAPIFTLKAILKLTLGTKKLLWRWCRWFMPVNILLTFIIGSILAWILIKITKTPPHLQGLVIGCCSAGNLGNLLLIIVPAVSMESNSPFGDSTICSTNGTTYASLSMAVWSAILVFFSVLL